MSVHQPLIPPDQQTSPPTPAEPAPRIAFEPAQLRPRHDGWTAERQIAFIETLVATKCVDQTCRRVGMSDTAAYELRNRSCGAAFRKAWDIALECQLDRVEHGAVERALNGVPRPIFYKGEQVGEWRHFDERLTMFLLRSRRPARFGKWIDQVLPERPDEDHRRYALDDAVLEMAYVAPLADGNPYEDLLADDDEDDESGAIE
jgi:hypothetical protein